MENLSKREFQISNLLAWGYTDKEIATKLFIAFDTARTHRRNIYTKIGARNLADLTRWVFKIEARAVGAFFMLALVISMEIININVIRTPALRAPKIARAKGSAKRKAKTLFI